MEQMKLLEIYHHGASMAYERFPGDVKCFIQHYSYFPCTEMFGKHSSTQ